MRKTIFFLSLMLILLITGCSPGSQQSTGNYSPEGGTTAPQTGGSISSGEPSQELAYPVPVVTEDAQEAAYPIPESGSPTQQNAYPPPTIGQNGSTGGSPYPAPGQPVGNNIASPKDSIPGEEKMTRGEVFLDKSEVVVLKTNPNQAGLSLTGSLPTPCHFLRVNVVPPDADKKINVEVYSLSDPAQVCVQVLQPFETIVELGSFASGTYTIWVNGQQVGEYTQ
ncbi:MAG: hypothetical protein GYA34_13360 [Chloroflexi bacterium]|nr:hypothetical protein [Chloroflexota bacterium]